MCLAYPQQLFFKKLCIGKKRHKHFIQKIVLFKQVLIRNLQFTSFRKPFLTIQQDILTQQLFENIVLLFQLVDGKVNRNQGCFKTSQQIFFIKIFLSILTDCPQQILVAQLIYFFQREGSLEFFVNLYYLLFHLFLLDFQLFNVFFHFFCSGFCVFHLRIKISLNILSFLFHTLQLIIQFFEFILQPLHLLVLSYSQFLIKLFDIFLSFLLSTPQHLPPHVYERPPHVLASYFFHNLKHYPQIFCLTNNDP